MNSVDNELSLAPLGAGDLIDRAVRLYRRHFLTLIRIAAPPVVVFALGSTITTIAFRELTATPDEMRMVLCVLMFLAGMVIMLGGSLFSLIVMGGATRNLVAHLLWNEAVRSSTALPKPTPNYARRVCHLLILFRFEFAKTITSIREIG